MTDLFHDNCPHCGQAMPQQDSPDFEAFWKAYPKRKGRKVGKDLARKQFGKSNIPQPLLMMAVKSYAKNCGDMPVDPHRWLRDNRWRDEPVDEIQEANAVDVRGQLEKAAQSAVRSVAEHARRQLARLEATQ